MRTFRRMYFLMAIDALIINLSIYLALWLRFDGEIPLEYLANFRRMAPFFTIVLLICFYFFWLYNRLWQYASTEELLSIIGAVSAGSVVNFIYSYLQMEEGAFPLPRSIFALSWMIIILLIGGSRFSWKLLRHQLVRTIYRQGRIPVLVVGAGDAGAMLAREMKNRSLANTVLVGFADDDPAKQKLQMFGVPVLGRRKDIPRLVDEYGIQEIIIAIPSAPGEVIREIVDICETTPAKLHILPSVYEMLEGPIVNQVRELQVEDLLDRETVNLDLASMAGYLRNRTVLVTGAGGSIGSELCRQVIRFAPSRLLMLDQSENSIYEIHQELADTGEGVGLIPLIFNVREQASVDLVFSKYRPHVVFHAAAHKHVPLMENNPAEAVKNNILGTWQVARAAEKYGTETFIFISTDKAVNPTSIMGATKRVAEMLVQQIAAEDGTRFASVRFGNVLDSRGSVVPLFRKQIARGGPVTVTHPEMVRYFMTIPEAVQLVIQAGALAEGGELFILDMGKPMKIVDLAKRMIRLAGYRPKRDIQIVFTGIRPGEKLFEEIFTPGEELGVTRHERIFTTRPDSIDKVALEKLIETISNPGWVNSTEEVIVLLQSVIPSFHAEDRSRQIEKKTGLGKLVDMSKARNKAN